MLLRGSEGIEEVSRVEAVGGGRRVERDEETKLLVSLCFLV
jgi:hypothetical protein